MKIVIGSDHAAFALKKVLFTALKEQNFNVEDVGTHSEESVDYPDFAQKVAKKVASQEADRGVMLCGSGIGACIVCNKFKNVRAGICHDTYSAHQGVEHDNMNVLIMGGRIVGEALALEILHSFIHAKFTDELRHVRRLNKLQNIENHNCN